MAKKSANKMLSKAKSLEKGGDIEAARGIYLAILEEFPKNMRARKKLEELDQSRRRYINSQVPKVILDRLIDLYNRGNNKRVLEEAESLLGSFPEHHLVWNIKGAAHRELGRLDNAETSFRKAIEFNPEFSDGFISLGTIMQDQGRFEEAKQAFSRALEISPDSGNAHLNIGNEYKRAGLADKAENAYRKAISFGIGFEAYANLGIVLHDRGDLESAIENLRKAIKINPTCPESHMYLGLCMQKQNDFDRAIELHERALAFRKDYADAKNNLGVCYQQKGELETAIELFSSALLDQSDPAILFNLGSALLEKGLLEDAITALKAATLDRGEFAEAFNSLGLAYQESGHLDEAIGAYRRAISIRAGYTAALSNLGMSLYKSGEVTEALGIFLDSISHSTDDREVFGNFGKFLETVEFSSSTPDLVSAVERLIDLKTCVRPKDISKAIISLIKCEPTIANVIQTLGSQEVSRNLKADILALSKFPLLLKLMEIVPLPDFELETILTELRANLLRGLEGLEESENLLKFQTALALQCFTNEYIYPQSDEEGIAVRELEADISKDLSCGKQPDPKRILCLASYTALNNFEWCTQLVANRNIESVIKRQIDEPLKELELSAEMRNLFEIDDEISLKVRDQYEKDPYPKWIDLALPAKPSSMGAIAKTERLSLFDDEIKIAKRLEVLIAGCGTGQQSVGAAAKYKNSQILAIDLSHSSIAYARRKTDEFGFDNVEYMPGDILALPKLGRRFDVIECSGVLHHMADPIAGWRSLTDCLVPGGLMRLGLYSDLARRDIAEIKRQIDQQAIASDHQSMRAFRLNLIATGGTQYPRVLQAHDFFSLSGLRDLLFHEKEHRFSIPQLQSNMSTLGLGFCGFERGHIREAFTSAFPDPHAQYDLDKWASFEAANPDIFSGMYQFWCQKF